MTARAAAPRSLGALALYAALAAATAATAAGVACTPPSDRPPAVPAAGMPVREAPAGLAVTLARGACHGTCPVYQVRVRELTDGRAAVRYEGGRNVARVGVATDTMSRAALARLVAALSAATFFSLPARYAYQEPSCPSYATDSPVVTTTVRRGARSHAVEHDYGCRDAPESLTAFERAVDEAARTERWIGPR